MTTNVQQSSAKIYQFPVGGRRGLVRQHEPSKPAVESGAPRVAAAVSGAWYHEAAIQDAKQTGWR